VNPVTPYLRDERGALRLGQRFDLLTPFEENLWALAGGPMIIVPLDPAAGSS
jgi:hypothetical protein